MKIVSGGQTGVDRAALDVAIGLELAYSGWVPLGGLAEDFPQAPGLLGRYPELRETATSDPAERTRLNVHDSDATLLLVAEPGGSAFAGTRLTEAAARRLERPLLIVRVDEPDAALRIEDWLRDLTFLTVLNVAGPRESESPGIYALCRGLLETLLRSYLGRAASRSPREGESTAAPRAALFDTLAPMRCPDRCASSTSSTSPGLRGPRETP